MLPDDTDCRKGEEDLPVLRWSRTKGIARKRVQGQGDLRDLQRRLLPAGRPSGLFHHQPTVQYGVIDFIIAKYILCQGPRQVRGFCCA